MGKSKTPIPYDRSLEYCFPEIAKEWDFKKNIGLSPRWRGFVNRASEVSDVADLQTATFGREFRIPFRQIYIYPALIGKSYKIEAVGILELVFSAYSRNIAVLQIGLWGQLYGHRLKICASWGANLLYLLEKHGHHAKINIREAKLKFKEMDHCD